MMRGAEVRRRVRRCEHPKPIYRLLRSIFRAAVLEQIKVAIIKKKEKKEAVLTFKAIKERLCVDKEAGVCLCVCVKLEKTSIWMPTGWSFVLSYLQQPSWFSEG